MAAIRDLSGGGQDELKLLLESWITNAAEVRLDFFHQRASLILVECCVTNWVDKSEANGVCAKVQRESEECAR